MEELQLETLLEKILLCERPKIAYDNFNLAFQLSQVLGLKI